MSRLEDQIRRFTEVMDSMAPDVEELMPPELADELDVEQRPGIEVRIPLGRPPASPRVRMPRWAWGLVGALAAAVVAVPLVLSLQSDEQPVASQPSTTLSPEPIRDGMVQNPANGHFYEAVTVTGPLGWDQARSDANSRSFRGVQGHLVTITSEEEDRFILESFADELNRDADGHLWLGGFQPDGSAEPDGGWQWVTGEPFEYTNWGEGEPNDAGSSVGSEQCLQYLDSTDPHWNDFPCGAEDVVYIVEYSTSLASAGYELAMHLPNQILQGHGWAPNTEVTATIVGLLAPPAAPAGNPYIVTTVSNGDFTIGPIVECCEIVMEITDGVETRTVDIQWYLQLWRVDPASDLIAGMTNGDSDVRVKVTGGSETYETTVLPTAGRWLVDLSGEFDLIPGMIVEVSTTTSDLTYTTQDGMYVNSQVDIGLAAGPRISGWGFLPGGLVDITVDGAALPDQVAVDIAGGFDVNLGLYGTDLPAGTVVVISDGVDEHTLIVPLLTFESLDPVAGTASGTADFPDGTRMWLNMSLRRPGGTQEVHWSVGAVVVGGIWEANFDPIPAGWMVAGANVQPVERPFYLDFPNLP